MGLLFSNASWAEPVQNQWMELNKIGQLIESVRTKLNADRSKQQIIYQELQGTRQNIHEVTHHIKNLHQKLVIHQSALETLKKNDRQYEINLKQQQSALSKQVYAAYQLSHYNYVDILLSQQDPHKISRSLHNYNYLNHARLNFIHHLRQDILKIKLNEQHAHQYSQSLSSLLEQQRTQWGVLSNKERVHQQNLGQLTNKIETDNEQLTQLITNKRALEKIIKRLEAAKLHDFPRGNVPFATLRGKLPWPTSGKISERFGAQIGQSELRYTGILIDASIGQTVYAVYPGKVVFADWVQGFGFLMIVDHGKSYMTLYGHNQRFLKKVGDFIQAGNAIASVGDSSHNHHSGLYFEIRHNGQATNPEAWFSASPQRT